MEIKMRMPDLGTVDDTIKVVRWLVGIGQPVRRGQPIAELETDKSIVELEATATGVLQTIEVPEGNEAAAGHVIATIAGGDDQMPVASASDSAQTLGKDITPGPAPALALPDQSKVAAVREHPSRARKPRSMPVERVRTAGSFTYSREFLLELHRRMMVIREFEEGVKFLFLEGSMPGTIHQCQGQEATAVGVCAALEPKDFITSTFRGHGHALAKGISQEKLLFELFGARTGCCGGKGGSMHVGDMNKGMVPGIAIVGGGIPLAAGMALALKMQKSAAVVACFFGDGAIAEGAFHEGVNLAAIWDLPVIFVCENNLYGASTRVDLVMRNPCIADRAASYGIRGETVDGNDVLAVYEATQVAAAECRRGEGPVFLELLTYRRTGHSRRDACHYQPSEEREEWLTRDPIERLGRVLIERGFAAEADLGGMMADVQHEFQAAVVLSRSQPMPSVDDLTTDVLA
jgi:TPP-dependent pyruvate/acetoin dehydrogenase alpha subunit